MSKYHSYIFNLKKTEADAAELVGRQAFDWKKLHAAEIAVSDGFVLSASAFDDFITASGIVEKISGLLKQVDEDDDQGIHRISREILAIIESANFPSIIIQPLLQAYHSLSGLNEKYVLIRPSWILPQNFVAPIKWQKEVKGEASVLYAVKQAWMQLFSPANLKLRAEKKYTGGLSMAVIVQVSPAPEASGTAFALNPQYDIEITAQLGVYNDKAGSDVYKYTSQTQHIHEKVIFPQAEMRVHKSRMAGTGESDAYTIVPISAAWQTFQKLPDNVISKLAQQTIAACKAFNDSVELSWSWETGHLHIFDVSPYFSLPGLRGDNLEKKVKKQLKIIEIGSNKERKPIKLNIRQLVKEVQEIAATTTSTTVNDPMRKEIAAAHTQAQTAQAKTADSSQATTQWRDLRSKLLINIGLDISGLTADVISQADKYDHFHFDATQMVLRNRQLPELLSVHNANAKQELVQKYAFELQLLAQVAQGKPIYYQFADIGKWELQQLNLQPEKIVDATERFIAYPQALEAEWQAIRIARKDFGLSNLKLVLPRLRSIDELIQLKKMLAGIGFTRTGVSQVWFELALPAALNELSQLSHGDSDGTIIHLPDLASALLDKHPVSANMAQAITAVERAITQNKFKLPHILYMPPNWQIIKRAWQSKLNPRGITLTRPITVAELEELVETEASQPIVDTTVKKQGRPAKPLF